VDSHFNLRPSRYCDASACRQGKQYKKPSNLAILGMPVVVLGIIFGDDRLIGYSFIGVGVLIAVVDAIRNRKR
jgi:hypothetical protein